MNARQNSSAFQADLLLLLVTIVASTGWIFSREAVAGLPPLTFMALRFGGASLILGALSYPSLKKLTAKQWRAASQVGGLFGISMIFWVLGLKLTSHVGIGAFLTSLGLLLVPLISRLFGERPGPYVYFALPFAMAGLACLSLDGEFHIGIPELCFLTSALIMSLMFVLNSRAATHISAMPLTAIQLFWTGIITGLCAVFFEPPAFQQPAAIWGWFAASLFIATCLRFVWQTHAMGKTLPSHSAIIMILEPVWAAVLATLWLGERMSGLQLAGCGLIFTAMLVNRWPALQQSIKGALKRRQAAS